ncbi:MAG TPA: hypothetical protein DEQ30_10270 [Porphyromonadaceae bacterium]|nr:hypothetical protein [Porphyromonadaceae bacterium]
MGIVWEKVVIERSCISFYFRVHIVIFPVSDSIAVETRGLKNPRRGVLPASDYNSIKTKTLFIQ